MNTSRDILVLCAAILVLTIILTTAAPATDRNDLGQKGKAAAGFPRFPPSYPCCCPASVCRPKNRRPCFICHNPLHQCDCTTCSCYSLAQMNHHHPKIFNGKCTELTVYRRINLLFYCTDLLLIYLIFCFVCFLLLLVSQGKCFDRFLFLCFPLNVFVLSNRVIRQLFIVILLPFKFIFFAFLRFFKNCFFYCLTSFKVNSLSLGIIHFVNTVHAYS